MERRLPTLIMLLCGWLAASAPMPPSVLAQNRRGTAREEAVQNVFLPAPRPLRQHLSRARRAIEDERYGDAVLELAPVLLGSAEDGTETMGEPQDFFLGSESPGDAQQSVKAEAQRMIGSMPQRGLDLYELQFGADARALLQTAVSETDFEKLNSVVRKYYHTKAGYEAMVLLGRLHLDRGQPLAAALCFQRIIGAPAARPHYDPEASVLLAVCWHMAGRSERAVEALAPLQDRFPERRLKIGGTDSDPLPNRDAALAWLRTHFPDSEAASSYLTEWLVHRGDSSRNATSHGGMPLRSLRWRAPTAESQTDETLIAEIQAGRLNNGESSVSSLSPIAVNEVIIMRSPDRMLAIDFASGKRIWEYPWLDSSYPTISLPQRGATPDQEMELRKLQLQQRLWRDLPYGQVSSDGTSVFLLDNLRYSSTSVNVMPGRRLAGRRRIQPNNQLVALDLDRQGALKWVVGSDIGLGELQLAGAFFLGAPLPMMGQLFAIAELRGEIRLVVLDSQTGEQQWSQQLAHMDTVAASNNQVRRLTGASPSFGDGILVCPTAAGAVVAIELASRSLLWGYQYLPQRNSVRRRIGTTRPSRAPWLDATAVVADGTVILTPAESDKLFCLDLLTGNPKWSLDKADDWQYLACVHRGKIVIVGRQRVTATKLGDGQPAWTRDVHLDAEQGEVVGGRGFQSGKFYYLPTTAARLLKIDLETGDIAEETLTDQPLGNLICYRNEVISLGNDYLTTFYQVDPLRRQVEERLKKSPDDAWALARQGELLVNAGELGLAIDSLRRAHELSPEDVTVRAVLVKTLLAAVRTDFPDYQSVAAELEELIDRPGQRFEYLQLMGSGLHAAGDLETAAQRYLELADLAIDDVRGQSLAAIGTTSINSTTDARLDRWLTVQFTELIQSADSHLQRWISEQISDRREANAGGSLEDLQRFLAFFDFHDAASDARIEYAERLAVDGRFLEAELSVFQLAQRSSVEHAVTAAARVATSLSRLGKDNLAGHFYGLLRNRWHDARDLTGQSGLEHFATASPSIRKQLTDTVSWNWGSVEVTPSPGRSTQLPRRPMSIPVVSTRNEAKGGRYHVVYDRNNTHAVTFRDDLGRVLLKTEVPIPDPLRSQLQGLTYAHRNGHLVVVVMKGQLFAIDTLRDINSDSESLLWSDRFAPRAILSSRQLPETRPRVLNPFDPVKEAFSAQARAVEQLGTLGPVNTHGVVILKTRQLVCLDPITGQTLWTRRNVERGSKVFGDDDHIFIAARKSRTATVLNAIDGSVIGTRRIPADRWTTNGRLVLAWEAQEQSTLLRVYDAWDEVDIWTESFELNARGTVADSVVAILEPSGRFQIRQLERDHIEVDAELAPEEALENIHLLSSNEQHLLVTNRHVEQRGVQSVNGGLPAPLVRGRIYAFARPSGESMWQSPAEIEDFGLPLHQPPSSPALWLIRRQPQVRAGSNRSSRANSKASILCLDRRDGRILHAADNVLIRTSSYKIEADPGNQTARLGLPGTTFNLRFTGEEVPPEPAANSAQALRQSHEQPATP